jgi:thioredoxin reductase
MPALYDVIIIGGGPAGLNAAVVLGRCLRKVLLFDKGTQRNLASGGMHNYLTRDGITPADFLLLATKEAKKYGVTIKKTGIEKATKIINGFHVTDDKGTVWQSKKLLIATGLRDKVPAIKGFAEMYGHSVFHCPYCDGWEWKNKRIGIYARNKNGVELALSLTTWTKKAILLTDGKRYVKPHEQKLLDKHGIMLVTRRIEQLEGSEKKLRKIIFTNNETMPCDAIVFSNGYDLQCSVVKSIGCNMSTKGVALTNRRQQTNIPGLYVAGDVAKDVHFVIVAAAEGAKAGVHINKELHKESL